MNLQRCYINLVCMHDDKKLKDIFEICGEIYSKLKYKSNFDYQVLELDIRDDFTYKCNGKIHGAFTVINENPSMKIICLTAKMENLTYNIYHAFGHFLQNEILTKQETQNIYQQYLEKSDIFNLPHDYSIIEDECIPQLVAHYFCEELNTQAKKFVQQKILK